MKYVWLVVLYLVPCLLTANENLLRFFEAGNRYYQQENFDSARIAYEQIAGQGYARADLFFNLANTYVKLHRPQWAIYYYEKALRLTPRDEDIRFNLNRTKLMLSDKIEPLAKPFYLRWVEQWAQILTLKEIQILWLITFSLGLTGAFIYIYQFRRRRLTLVKLALTLILAALTLETMWLVERARFYQDPCVAILISDEIEVKVSPSKEAEAAFIIHAGIKLHQLQRREDWIEIQLENGYTGWIPIEHCQFL